MSKANRDAEFFGMPAEERRKFRRSSQRNVQLHPMYVDDYAKETGVELTAADKGFGNTIYRTYFPVIYTIERVDR